MKTSGIPTVINVFKSAASSISQVYSIILRTYAFTYNVHAYIDTLAQHIAIRHALVAYSVGQVTAFNCLKRSHEKLQSPFGFPHHSITVELGCQFNVNSYSFLIIAYEIVGISQTRRHLK